MPAKQILFRQAVSAKIIAWMNILANTVKVILAPRGHNVIVERAYGPSLVPNNR
ncbi:hypothetical protein [Nitrosomonas communis]|uniref:hypothetical protein n=1 Tax=Nitrosomonas communis TaxID=44574 RepID=UPI003D272C78